MPTIADSCILAPNDQPYVSQSTILRDFAMWRKAVLIEQKMAARNLQQGRERSIITLLSVVYSLE